MQALLPAAEYLRVSTEKQTYTLESQHRCIRKFAEMNGLRIVRTYVDIGKSGLNIRGRRGLKELISEVLSADVEYSAVLVYDISRWGRFQDIDEAAHYEFLCRRAGIQVLYCADPEVNPIGGSSILKALRRVMAAEFSRELSAKVFASQRRSAEAGFKVGACPLGYRRLLVSPDRVPKYLLGPKELKPRTADKVVLVLGPSQEVACVREIFALAAEGKRPAAIERIAAAKGWTREDGRPLLRGGISYMLSNPVYTGDMVWNRHNAKLHSRMTRNPPKEWVRVPGAIDSIVDQNTFLKAQVAPRLRNRHTDSEVLEQLHTLLNERGKLSQQIIEDAWRKGQSSAPGVYYRRFGGLTNVFKLLGYEPSHPSKGVLGWMRRQFRDRFMKSIVDLAPNHFAIFVRSSRARSMLQLNNRVLVSVRICYRRGDRTTPTWRLTTCVQEDQFPTLLVLMGPNGSDIDSCYVLPRVRSSCIHDFKLNTDWFKPAIRLDNPIDLFPRLMSLIHDGGR